MKRCCYDDRRDEEQTDKYLLLCSRPGSSVPLHSASAGEDEFSFFSSWRHQFLLRFSEQDQISAQLPRSQSTQIIIIKHTFIHHKQ